MAAGPRRGALVVNERQEADVAEAPNDGPREHFSERKARHYDDEIQTVVPGYGLLHRLCTVLLGTQVAPEAHILVVGSGTGTDVLAMAAAYQGWRFTAVEPSSAMMATARRRLTREGVDARVHLIEDTVLALPSDAAFDAAVCILVSHFLADDGRRAGLFAAIGGHLRRGAPLLLADLHRPHSDRETVDQTRAWHAWCRSEGWDDDKIGKMVAHLARDVHPLDDGRLATLLDEASFEPPIPFFRSLMFQAWWCRRR